MVAFKSAQNKHNTQYTPHLQYDFLGATPPFLPPLQLRYMPNDLMTVRRPQPSICIYANSVVKEELGKLVKCESFNRGTTSPKCAIS